jgi:signal transduction histidine kinase
MGTLSWSPETTRKLRPYFFSVLIFCLALFVRDALTPVLGMSLPHATFMVATAFSAWFLGFGPGVLTMILGLPAADYFFTPPIYTWSAFTWGELPATFTYVVASSALLGMGVANQRRARELEQKNLQIEKQSATVELSNQRLRELSVRLLHTQDEERRRIARELHDSVGQYLSSIGMLLGEIGRSAQNLPAAAYETLRETSEMVKGCSSEVRTISYLLHPPLLEEMGLASAVRWYIEGFARRSGIQVQLEVPEDLHRLGDEVELVLFRVLQESLTNVHRHSGSKVAAVRIGSDSRQVWLEIRDQGKGISNKDSLKPGVGISGMQERIRDLAGVLEFSPEARGTLVKAVIPLPAGPRGIAVDPAAPPQQRQSAARSGG